MAIADHQRIDVSRLLGTGPQRPDRLFDQVVDKIAVGIVSGRYATGDVLPNEGDLAAELPVSRSAFREAIKFIAAKGLIEAKPKTGTRVRPRADWNLLDPDILRWSLQGGATVEFARDLFELRRTIEPEAVRLAAERHTTIDLGRIEAALLQLEALPPLGAASIAADLEFHERLFEACGNPAIACLKGVVATTILWSRNVKRAIGPDEFVRSLADHRRIFEAVAARDGALAAAQTVLLIADAFAATEFAMRRAGSGSTGGLAPRGKRSRGLPPAR
jgi:DNA-binding FadR family transcriptional regulator